MVGAMSRVAVVSAEFSAGTMTDARRERLVGQTLTARAGCCDE
jgi:hypothetical protein